MPSQSIPRNKASPMIRKQENEEEEKDSPENIHVNPSTPLDPSVVFITKKVLKFNSFFESLGLVPQSFDIKVVCTKGGDGEVMFIELIRNNDDSSEGEPEEGGSTTTEGIMRRKLNPRENSNRGVSNFTGRIKGIHVFVGNFTYIVDFMIVEDISSIIDPRNEEDKRRGVEYVMSKILGFYKECLELGPEYVTGMDDEGEVTLYLMRRSLEVLRKFHWIILGGRFNQLSHVSSPLLSKPMEY
ncbi:hypothetical protein Tco_0276569 [Tanacetum coccineum]